MESLNEINGLVPPFHQFSRPKPPILLMKTASFTVYKWTEIIIIIIILFL